LHLPSALNALQQFAKTILPFLVGITVMTERRHCRWMLWTIVLAEGYVGFELNLDYIVKGYNTASLGFGGMDNNFLGLTLVTGLGPAVALAITSRRWDQRLAAGGVAVLVLHSALLTFSRGTMLGLLAIGLMAFVIMPKRPRYLAALAIVLLIAVRLTGPELAARYASTFASDESRDGSAESRIDLWKDCLKVMEAHPVFGVGPWNWSVVAASYGWPAGKSAHSVWMETAAETGLPGVFFLISFFAATMWRLWPLARMPMTDENRDDVALASGVILSLVGFAVAGQFVSATNPELAYYVAMVGIALLKTHLRPAEDAATTGIEDRTAESSGRPLHAGIPI
jgi:O-antigen ligase